MMQAPVEEGDILTLQCTSKGKKGDGLFKKENFVIIVPEAILGKQYEIKITKVMEKVAFGMVLHEVN